MKIRSWLHVLWQIFLFYLRRKHKLTPEEQLKYWTVLYQRSGKENDL
jgi:hypothetical protein